MIKSFVIVVLTVALLASVFVTRPSELSARAFLAKGSQPQAAAPLTVAAAVKEAILKGVDDGQDGVPRDYVFKDRILWTEVQKDGKTLYTGLLSHWISTPPAADSPKDHTTRLASR